MPLQLHNALGWILVLTTLGLVGYWVPAEEQMLGNSYLIFFFHFPSALNCMNLFIFAGVASAIFLRRPGQLKWDFWAASAVEVGVLACTITLVTGSIWAKAAWNIFWDFTDPRLMTVAIMWFTYVAYLVLRSVIEDPHTRARFCGVFGVIATINVPISYFSIQWFGRVNHPNPMKVDMSDASMSWTQWIGTFAFLVLYTAMWRLRYRLLLHAHESRALEESFSRARI